MMHNVDGAGGGFVTAFTACLDQLGVEIQKGTKLVEVLLDAEGKTEGAVVEAKGKTQRIKARAIMIATGGYAHNAELAARFDPEKAGTFGIGHPNCEGEGLVAASNAGALLSHTNDMMCVVKDYTIMSEHDGTSASANLNGFTNLPNMILVGADGKRFVDEGKKGFMSQDLNGPIFDKIHRDGMGYVWEISDEATVAAAGGKVKRGEGLEYIKGADATELAANMGVDAAALAETIEAYNAAVDSGVDREIGGFPTAKLEAPFLAVPVVPCEIITYGGVARTEQGEVILHGIHAFQLLHVGSHRRPERGGVPEILDPFLLHPLPDAGAAQECCTRIFSRAQRCLAFGRNLPETASLFARAPSNARSKARRPDPAGSGRRASGGGVRTG